MIIGFALWPVCATFVLKIGGGESVDLAQCVVCECGAEDDAQALDDTVVQRLHAIARGFGSVARFIANLEARLVFIRA